MAGLILFAGFSYGYWRWIYVPSEFRTRLRNATWVSLHDRTEITLPEDLLASRKTRTVELFHILRTGQDQESVVACRILLEHFVDKPGQFLDFLDAYWKPGGFSAAELRTAYLIDHVDVLRNGGIMEEPLWSAYLRWRINTWKGPWAASQWEARESLIRLIRLEKDRSSPFLLSVVRRPWLARLHGEAAAALVKKRPVGVDLAEAYAFLPGLNRRFFNLFDPSKFRSLACFKARQVEMADWALGKGNTVLLREIAWEMVRNFHPEYQSVLSRVIRNSIAQKTPASLPPAENSSQNTWEGDGWLTDVLVALPTKAMIGLLRDLQGAEVRRATMDDLIGRLLVFPMPNAGRTALATWLLNQEPGMTRFASEPNMAASTRIRVRIREETEDHGNSPDQRWVRRKRMCELLHSCECLGTTASLQSWISRSVGSLLEQDAASVTPGENPPAMRILKARFLGALLVRHGHLLPDPDACRHVLLGMGRDTGENDRVRFEAAFWLAKTGSADPDVRAALQWGGRQGADLCAAAIVAETHITRAGASGWLSKFLEFSFHENFVAICRQANHIAPHRMVENLDKFVHLCSRGHFSIELNRAASKALSLFLCVPVAEAVKTAKSVIAGDREKRIQMHWARLAGLDANMDAAALSRIVSRCRLSHRALRAALMLIQWKRGQYEGWDRSVMSYAYAKEYAARWLVTTEEAGQ